MTKETLLNELNKSAYLEVDYAEVDWSRNSVVCEVINTGNRMQDEPDRYLGVADLPEQREEDEGRYCLESIEQLLNPSRRDRDAAEDRKELYELFEHILNTKEKRRAAFRIRESAGASGNPFEIIDMVKAANRIGNTIINLPKSA